VTNFALPGERKAPLNRLLRQLRIPYEALGAVEQKSSAVSFPQVRLAFGNELDQLYDSVRDAFPDKLDAFSGLVGCIREMDAYSYGRSYASARENLGRILGEGQLAEMLLCPMMYYGSAWEHDMDFGQFAILFRSVFLEGFWRPAKGMVSLLAVLADRLAESGAEIRLRTGVEWIGCRGGRVCEVTLDGGETLSCGGVLSCAGHPETLALCRGVELPDPLPCRPGRMSFVESLFLLDCIPAALGLEQTIVFRSLTDRFHFADPGTLVDERSATVCVPANFRYPHRPDDERMVRVTSIASYDAWRGLSDKGYAEAKEQTRARQLALLEDMAPGIARHVVAHDTFTPLTVERFTGHRRGAIYGSPDKVSDGRTPVEGLFLCGTDQGFLGIVGSLLSGISMANYHFLG
jgi:phytoene dehydrogenase-like protein